MHTEDEAVEIGEATSGESVSEAVRVVRCIQRELCNRSMTAPCARAIAGAVSRSNTHQKDARHVRMIIGAVCSGPANRHILPHTALSEEDACRSTDESYVHRIARRTCIDLRLTECVADLSEVLAKAPPLACRLQPGASIDSSHNQPHTNRNIPWKAYSCAEPPRRRSAPTRDFQVARCECA